MNKTPAYITSRKNRFTILFFTILSLVNFSFSDSNDYFSIIILPDTQYYTSRFPDFIYQQMNWIVENKNPLNIQYVVHMGDITDDNKKSAWEVASSSYKILENAGIPYSVVCGDNDIKNPSENNYDGTRHTELLNRYFPVSRFDKPGSWWKGGFFEPGKIDNYYCLFNYRDHRYMIMNLEIAPRSPVLKWANNICLQNGSEKVIVVTHDYLDRDGKHLDDLKTFALNGKDAYGKPKGNNADEVFKKLIKKNPNILMVLCGHKNGTYENTVKIPLETGKTRKVFEILSDFQDEKMKGSDERSGKGLLRVLKVYPERNEFVLLTVNAMTGKTKEEEIHLFLKQK